MCRGNPQDGDDGAGAAVLVMRPECVMTTGYSVTVQPWEVKKKKKK